MSAPKWTVNSYHAAACIRTSEINRKMKEEFDNTSNLPKKWQSKDEDNSPPEWELDVNLAAPAISFKHQTDDSTAVVLEVTAIGNNIKINDIIAVPVNGTTKKCFKEVDSHQVQVGFYATIQGCKENVKVNGRKMKLPIPVSMGIDLKQTKFTIETPMKGISHVAQPKGTTDQDFTVESLFVDMESPSLIAKIFAPPHTKYFNYSDISTSIQSVVLGQAKKYKDKYLIGKSTVPNVGQTTGPFKPTAVKYSSYYETEDNSCLNWNLMFAYDALPPASDNQAGMFPSFPVIDGTPGTMIISHGKIMTEILTKGTFKYFNAGKQDQFSFNQDAVTADLKKKIAWTSPNAYEGEYEGGNISKIHISVDANNNRYQVDIEISDIQKVDTNQYSGGTYGGGGQMPDPTKYSGSWTGYLKPTIKDGKLDFTYSQDKKITYHDHESTGIRVLIDIATLGLHELQKALNRSQIHDDISNYAKDAPKPIVNDIADCIELPGESVFVFDENHVKLTGQGLLVGLKYK